MPINGVVSSELVRIALEKDAAQLDQSTNVPIGQTVVTNDPTRNSPNARLLNEGVNIENLGLDQFSSSGRESLYLNRDDDTNKVTYSAERVPNAGKIVEISFDKDAGTLVIVKQNKEIVKVEGFLTQKDYGVGPSGARGNRGLDGDDGDDGADASSAGKAGCRGPVGLLGAEGIPGVDGQDGPIGSQGPPGPEGPEGTIGPTGEQGQPGNEGSRGLRGDNCSSTESPLVQGAVGETANTSVVISSAEPDNLSVLWGIPS